MIPRETFDHIVARLRALGFADHDIEWSENVGPPPTADEFALETIFVICNSGMKNTVARRIYERVRAALLLNGRPGEVFGHQGKVGAIEHVWRHRAQLFAEYLAAPDKLGYLATLPWIGEITKYHLAKNFGVDCAKPDVHLRRLADLHQTSVHALCADLATQTGWRVATIDLLLWRACAEGVIESRTGQIRGGLL
jgi:hypothetical protein